MFLLNIPPRGTSKVKVLCEDKDLPRDEAQNVPSNFDVLHHVPKTLSREPPFASLESKGK